MARHKKDYSDMDLAGDLIGDVGAIFFVLLKHRSIFFGEVILPEISLETSEQKFCTNVASEQKNSDEVLQRLLRCKSAGGWAGVEA
jgi:hypothetical protein